MSDKEILKKLFKIARNQQKIITKLAQQVAPEQVWNVSIAQGFLPAGYVVTDAAAAPSERTVTATVQVPKSTAGTNAADPIWLKFKQDAGQYLASVGYQFAGGNPVKSF